MKKKAQEKKISPATEKEAGVSKAKELSRFMDSSTDVFIRFDSNLNFCDINRTGLKKWGFKRSDLIGKNVLSLFPYIKNTERYARYKGIIKTGKPFIAKGVAVPPYPDRYVNLKAFKIGDGLGLIVTEVTDRVFIEKKLEKTHENLRKLSLHLQSVKEEESRRIAREIHDELSQSFTALKMGLNWITRGLSKEQKAQKSFRAKIKTMADLIDNTAKTVKRISSVLRPELLDDLGLAAAVDWQIQQYQSRTKIICTFKTDCEDLELNPDLSISLFRVFQEALTNIARHAEATNVRVSLKIKARDRRLELKIKDNGCGITKKEISNPKSLGLVGMRERLYLVNGKLKITGIPGKGTALIATLPLERSQ